MLWLMKEKKVGGKKATNPASAKITCDSKQGAQKQMILKCKVTLYFKIIHLLIYLHCNMNLV